MSERKLENSILWITCIILLSSVLTILFLLDLSIFPIIKLDFSGMAALITSVVTLFTLLEIRKQRRKMYEPSLTFIKETHEFSILSPFFNQVDITLLNIGYGAAKNLHIEWSYTEALSNIAEPMPELNNVAVIIGDAAVVHVENDRTQDIDYILPVNIEATPKKVSVPMIVTYYILNRFLKDVETRKPDGIYISHIPFFIKYKDVNDDKHVLNLELQISFTMLDSNKNTMSIDTVIINK